MAYKINVTQKDFEESLADGKAETIGAADKKKKKEKGNATYKWGMDYYLDLINRYKGKTVGDVAKEHYEGERLTPDSRTDEELYSQAQDYATAQKSEKQNTIQSKADANKVKLEDEKRKVQTEATEDINAENAHYEVQSKQSKNDAIKQGIARSSIIENLLKSHSNNRNASVKAIKSKAKEESELLNQKISAVEEELAKSLKSLDMQSAVVLNEELTRLKEERNKTNEKVAKHNAEVDKKIANYANELIKTEDGKAIKELMETGGGKYVEKAKELFIKYVSTLPLEDAYEEIEKPIYKELLGERAVENARRYLNSIAKNNG